MKTSILSFLFAISFIIPSLSIFYQPEPVMPSIEFKCTPLFRNSPCYENLRAIGIKADGSYQEYENGCKACDDLNVVYFNRLGPCPAITERRCTDFNQPICGRLGNGTLKSFNNECEACRYDEVHSYLARACP